jgi:hypothetical protein
VSAILGTFVRVSTLADGSPRLVLDLQCSLSEIAAMGLIPGVPFALARLEKEAAVTPVVEPVEKPGPLCIMACNFCADPKFWEWISNTNGFDTKNEIDAKDFITSVLSIHSRKEIDSNSEASAAFHSCIRTPYLAWKAKH